jgi:hypothetical protein
MQTLTPDSVHTLGLFGYSICDAVVRKGQTWVCLHDDFGRQVWAMVVELNGAAMVEEEVGFIRDQQTAWRRGHYQAEGPSPLLKEKRHWEARWVAYDKAEGQPVSRAEP